MSIPTADRQVVTTPLTTAHQHSAGVLTITSDRGEAELVGPASAQAMTGYSEAELVACINAGTLPCFDLGGLGVYRFKVSDLNRLVFAQARSELDVA